MSECSPRNFAILEDICGILSALTVHGNAEQASRDGTVQTTRRRPAAARIALERVHELVAALLGDDVHAARVLSFASGVVGLLHAAALGVHPIGRGLADARGLDPKHAIKPVDPLLSNTGITVGAWFESWALFVGAARQEIVVALDWTELDKDDRPGSKSVSVSRARCGLKSPTRGSRQLTRRGSCGRSRGVRPDGIWCDV